MSLSIKKEIPPQKLIFWALVGLLGSTAVLALLVVIYANIKNTPDTSEIEEMRDRVNADSRLSADQRLDKAYEMFRLASSATNPTRVALSNQPNEKRIVGYQAFLDAAYPAALAHVEALSKDEKSPYRNTPKEVIALILAYRFNQEARIFAVSQTENKIWEWKSPGGSGTVPVPWNAVSQSMMLYFYRDVYFHVATAKTVANPDLPGSLSELDHRAFHPALIAALEYQKEQLGQREVVENWEVKLGLTGKEGK